MDKLIAYIIILLPILESQPIYTYIPTSVMYLGIMFLLYFIIIIKANKKIITINKIYLVFVSIVVLINLINIPLITSYANIGNICKGLVNIISFFMIISIVLEYIDIDLFHGIYSKVCNLVSLQIIIQYILYYGFNIRTNVELFGIKLFTDNLYEFYRPSAIFSEPSILAGFFVIIILLELFRGNKKKAMFYTVISLATTSNNAILFAAVIWGLYIIKRVSMKKIIAAVSIFILVVNLNTPTVNLVKERLLSGGTYNARITRAKIIFEDLNKKEKILGVGLQNVNSYSKTNEIITEYDEINGRYTEYMSTVWYFFISSGLISGVAFLFFIFWIILKGSYESRVLALIFLLLCYTSNIMTSFIWCLYLVLILKFGKNRNIKMCLQRG